MRNTAPCSAVPETAGARPSESPPHTSPPLVEMTVPRCCPLAEVNRLQSMILNNHTCQRSVFTFHGPVRKEQVRPSETRCEQQQ